MMGTRSIVVCLTVLALQAHATSAQEKPPGYAIQLLEAKTQSVAFATATLVKYKDHVYVVTALHTLQQKEGLQVNNGSAIRLQGLIELIEGELLFNRIFDLAVFRVDMNRQDKDDITAEAIELLGESSLPVGTPTSAVGNPSLGDLPRVAKNPKNIGYGCTVSQFLEIANRVTGHVDLNHELGAKATDQPRMFLESASVDRGFSGGPVVFLRNSSPFLAGIIVGGLTSQSSVVKVGRFVWASTADDLRRMFDSYDTAPREELTGSHAVIQDKVTFVESPILWNKTDTPYQDLSFAGRETVVTSNAQAVEVLRDTEAGMNYVFRNVRFDSALGSVHLANARFESCQFGSRFDASQAVMTGAVFEDCIFTAFPLNPLAGAGVRYIRPSLIEDMLAEEAPGIDAKSLQEEVEVMNFFEADFAL